MYSYWLLSSTLCFYSTDIRNVCKCKQIGVINLPAPSYMSQTGQHTARWLPHLQKSYHISRRATTSPEEQPHLQMSYHISRWATTFFRWATIAFDKTLMWIDAQVLREFILMTCTEFGKSLLLFISWKILFFFIIHSRSGLVFWESIKKTAPFIIKKCRGKKTATLF